MAGVLLRWMNRLIVALAGLGATATVALVGVTFVGVTWRYGLGQPIYGIDDIAKMALVVIVACSLAYGAQRGAHVYVDVLDRLWGRRATRIADVLARIIGNATVSFTAWALAAKGSCGSLCGNTTSDLSIPHMPFYMLLAGGFGLYGLVLLHELVAGLVAWAEPCDPNEH